MAGQNRTAIKDHLNSCEGNSSSLDDFEILGRDTSSEFNLRIKESLFINRGNPNLNIQGSYIPLDLFKN